MQATYEEEAAKTSNSAILHQLADYLLPRDNAEYRWRIGTALGLLVASKGLNVAVGCLPHPDLRCAYPHGLAQALTPHQNGKP